MAEPMNCLFCDTEITRSQFFAESEEDFQKRLAVGYCRSKCKRLDPNVKAKPRHAPTLALKSYSVGVGELTQVEKTHRFASIPYRRFVASYPCCHCLKMGSDPHHHQEPGEGCMGGKVGDDKCLPLCSRCHRDVHDYGREVWELWGIKPLEVIAFMQDAWWNKFGTRPWINLL